MSDVRLQRMLNIPPVPAFAALREALSGIAAGDSQWRDFVLHVGLKEVHLPDVGYLAIPIHLTVGQATAGIHEIALTFRAARHPESFPTFNGSAGIDTTGPSGSILWVAGAYDVPLHLFGKLIDATIASGVAQRTLENLADDLAAAVFAMVEKREAEYMRYSLYRR
jgi:hypothetical protein